MKASKRSMSIKDIVIVTIFLVLAIIQICYQVFAQGIADIGYLINSTLLLLLAFIGFEDIANYYNWNIFVPDFYIKALEEKDEKRAASLVREFFERDIKYVNIYNEERMRFLLSQMQITVDQLDQIRLELINMRCLPLKTTADAQELIRLYIRDSEYPNIVIHAEKESSLLTYREVDYYINFYDIMFDHSYQMSIAAALATTIKESGIRIKDIDRIVVPYDSNLLLAVGVSNILGPPVVKMRKDKGRIIRDQPWDGDLQPESKVIIVHDVLVKSDQIVLALNKLPDDCDVLGVFCLVARTEWNGTKKLSRRLKAKENTKDAQIASILTLDEDDIRQLRND